MTQTSGLFLFAELSFYSPKKSHETASDSTAVTAFEGRNDTAWDIGAVTSIHTGTDMVITELEVYSR